MTALTEREWSIPEVYEEYVFLAGVYLFTLVFFLESLSLSADAAVVPRMAMVGIVLAATLRVVELKLGTINPFALAGMGSDDDKNDIEASIEEQLDNIDLPSIRPRDAGIVIGWIVAYILSIQYVGFFTSTFTFMTAYIFVRDNELSGLRRFVVPPIWGAAMCIFLYYFFAELLRVGSIFRLGFML